MKRLLILGALALGPLSVCAAPASAQTFCSTPDAFDTNWSVRVGYGSGYGDRCPDRGPSYRYDRERYDGRYDGGGYGGRYDGGHRHESRRSFRVMYRQNCHASWRVYASYGCREDADRACRGLYRDGCEASVFCD